MKNSDTSLEMRIKSEVLECVEQALNKKLPELAEAISKEARANSDQEPDEYSDKLKCSAEHKMFDPLAGP